MRKQPQPKPEGVTKPPKAKRRGSGDNGDPIHAKPTNIRPVPPPSSQLKDGGSAFPRHALVMDEAGVMHVATVDGSGMSLRDYFAAAALTGLIASDTLPPDLREVGTITHERLAIDAYLCADAMIEARKG